MARLAKRGSTLRLPKTERYVAADLPFKKSELLLRASDHSVVNFAYILRYPT